MSLVVLKNLKTDGAALRSCPLESIIKIDPCTPLTLGLSNYYLKADGFYRDNILLKAHTFIAPVKIINLIKFIIVQDNTRTFFIDKSGIYTANPSGNEIPMANSLATIPGTGQIVAGGTHFSALNLDKGYIRWSDINSDNFDLTKQNTAGIYNPNIGEVMSVQPLQDSYIVLGTRGACQMYFASHTFGFRDLDIPLINPNKTCATSSTNLVLYIDQDNNLVQIDKNGSFLILGYSWIAKDTVDLKYLNGRNQFVLTTALQSYHLDSKGMFSYGYKTFGEFNKELAVSTDFEQTTWEFRTNFYNLDRAGFKTLEEIYIRDGLSNSTVIGYCETLEKTFGYKTLNNFEACKYRIVGNKIAIGYKATIAPTISDFALEFMKIDKRFGSGKLPYNGGKNVSETSA